MSKYNFQTAPNRLSHHTYKWKETETDPQLLPAWIADMDFEVMPEVKNAIHDYAEQLVYGYTYASDELLQAVLDWEKANISIRLIRILLFLWKVLCQPFLLRFKPLPKKEKRS